MIASNTTIERAIRDGLWTVTRDGQSVGVDDLNIGPNSVNFSLQPTIKEIVPRGDYIDLHDENSYEEILHSCEDGFILQPGRLYLGAARESFDFSEPVWVPQEVRQRKFQGFENGHPYYASIRFELETLTTFFTEVDGRSSCGRIGLGCHICAGRGDWPFGHDGSRYTLELFATEATMVRAYDEIGQVYGTSLSEKPSRRYQGAYNRQTDGPQGARLGRARFQRTEEGR